MGNLNYSVNAVKDSKLFIEKLKKEMVLFNISIKTKKIYRYRVSFLAKKNNRELKMNEIYLLGEIINNICDRYSLSGEFSVLRKYQMPLFFRISGKDTQYHKLTLDKKLELL